MGELFNNKYRIESARLKGWDYASDGAYFITICTKDREHFFGECLNGKMKLSTMGAIVQGFWYDIPAHFPQIRLDVFVVMPNHIHGILVLDKSLLGKNAADDNDNDDVETLHATSLQPQPQPQPQPHTPAFYQAISPDAGSIATVVRSFKSVCTKHIRAVFPNQNFAWQERFWDTIIRDEASWDRISNYIITNPANWDKDKFYEP